MKKLIIFALASVFCLQASAQFEGMMDYAQMSFATNDNRHFWVYFDNIPQNEMPTTSLTVHHIAAAFVTVDVYLDNRGHKEKVISGEKLSCHSKDCYFVIFYDQRRNMYLISDSDPFGTAVKVKCKSADNAVLGAIGGAWDLGMNVAQDELNNMPPEERGNVQVNITVNTNGGGHRDHPHGNANRHHPTPPPAHAPTPQPPTPPAPVFCSDRDFAEAYNVVKSEPFDDNRISLAKQIISSQNLTIEQLIQLVSAIDFEESKLEVLKYAYDFSLQKDRYYLVNKVLEFSASKDELNEYIQSRQ